MLDVIRRNSQSWVVKAIFGAIIITFVFWGASSMTSDSADVLAKVNGESILRNDLLRELRAEIQNMQVTNPKLGRLDDDELEGLAVKILSNMVRRAMLAQEAEKLGLAVSDAELSAAITGVPDFHSGAGRFDHDLYKERVAALGMSVGKFEEMMAADLMVSKLQDYIAGGVSVDAAEARRIFNFEMERRVVEYIPFTAEDFRGEVKPDESAVITYYSENKAAYTVPARADVEYLVFDMDVLAGRSAIGDAEVRAYYDERKAGFVEPASYHVRHILISLPLSLNTTDEAVQEARKKADAVMAELRSGKSFAQLAKTSSDDTATSANGGDLGWVRKGQLDPSLDLAVSALKPGDISEPVRSFNGFHILMLDEVKLEREKPFEEVRGEILAQLKEDAAYSNMGKVMSDVEDKIITRVGFENIAKEYGVRVKSSGLLELTALAPALGLEPGRLDGVGGVAEGEMLPAPIDTGRGFMVVRVKSYKPSYVPELDEVRARVVDAIKDREALVLASAAASDVYRELAKGGAMPRALGKKVKESLPATRFLGVLELGVSRDITSAVFTAPKGQWLERVFLAGDSAVLLRVKEVLPAEDKDWVEVSGAYIEGLNNARKNEVFGVYLSQLQKESKIEVKSDRILRR